MDILLDIVVEIVGEIAGFLLEEVIGRFKKKKRGNRHEANN